MLKTTNNLGDFPIICLGGASVDLDAYTELIGNLPPALDAAVIVINHVKGVQDALFEALTRCARMPVAMITDGLPVRSNRIFLLSQGYDLHVGDEQFRLKPVSKPTGWTNVVTVFLTSLCSNWRGQVVAVILSGLDGDGAEALGEIKRVGGITIAQEVASAGDPNMPAAAIATGNVDLVLSVQDIARQIVQIAQAKKMQALP